MPLQDGEEERKKGRKEKRGAAAYKKILVAYDISNPSDRALGEAVKMARSSGGSPEIILFHVIPEIPVYPVMERLVRSKQPGRSTTFASYAEQVYEQMKKHVKDLLEEKKKEAQDAGVNFRTEVSLGKPIDRIIEFAKKEGVDLVVVGNVGVSGVSRLKTLGSVSRGVAERASCPVMIVH